MIKLMNFLGAVFAALLKGDRTPNNHSGSGIGSNKEDRGGGSSGAGKNSSDDHIDSDDPFEVLGLKGDKADTTIDEAKKAMRKLALKWHPDRNADNVEEATEKMQKINHAFEEVERILKGGGEARPCQEEDVQESGDDESVKSESEGAHQRARKKRTPDEERNERRRMKKQRRKMEKQRRKAAQAATREVREEFASFQRAQMNAAQGIFESATFTATTPSASKKMKHKSNWKRVKKAAARVRRQEEEEEWRKWEEGSFPFHRLPVEKRCVAKFGSKELVKTPTFTAIRTRAYNVLHVLTSLQDSSDGIELPARAEGGEHVKIFVTPLMVASYLGDYDAAAVILENAGEEWWKAVLAESLPKGGDSLALAKEALEIAQKLHAESRENRVKVETQEERDLQDKIVAEHAERLEMAEKLVERLEGMKELALKKKKDLGMMRLVGTGVGLALNGLVLNISRWVFARR